jgi:hypothetical protein
MYKVILFVYFLFFDSALVLASPNQCSRNEAIQAETEASTLPNWDSVYQSYIKYSKCDDGAIWEGYSESVGRLLAKDWENVSILYNLGLKNEGFKNFVIKHIDDIVLREYLDQIIKNTQSKCPANLKEFCHSIEIAASYK